MRKILCLALYLAAYSNYYGQSIFERKYKKSCEVLKVVPVEDINNCNTDPYLLIFEDNFDSTELNQDTWTIRISHQGSLYGDFRPVQEYNTLKNCEVSNGKIDIVAKKESIDELTVFWKDSSEILEDGLPNYRHFNYTSSNIWTRHKFRYGYYESRIKIPKGKGFWPAFWIYSGINNEEIDIFEFWNEWGGFKGEDFKENKLSKVLHMTSHKDSSMCLSDWDGNIDFSLDYHIFGLNWNASEIIWYLDGQEILRFPRYYDLNGKMMDCSVDAWNTYLMNLMYPSHPMNIVLNLAIQYGFQRFDGTKTDENSPDGSTVFPSKMEVDYVRYYKQLPCHSNTVLYGLNSIDFTDEEFNVVVGQNVTIIGNDVLQSGQQLTIIASESITLDSNFTISAGSDFEIQINPDLCNKNALFSLNSEASNTGKAEIDSFAVDDKANLIEKKNQLKFLSSNFLDVTLDDENLLNLNLEIYNCVGQKVYSETIIKSEMINLDYLGSGVYFVVLKSESEIYDTLKLMR